jgi:hypothetical protein
VHGRSQAGFRSTIRIEYGLLKIKDFNGCIHLSSPIENLQWIREEK